MLRFASRLAVSLVLFVVTISIAGEFANGLASLLMYAGSPLLSEWNSEHQAWRAFVVGIVAGLAPATLLFSAFLWFAREDNPDTPRARRFLMNLNIEPLQPWTWLFASPLFLLVILRWTEWRSHFSNVFESSSPYSFSSFVEYWNSVLSTVDPRSKVYVSDWSRLQQVFYIWLIATAIGYSVAPFLRKLGQSTYRSTSLSPDQTDEGGVAESTINEKIDSK